ncbi:hydroxyneurosporene methyltransferase-like protein [Leptotrombidium deliense]|uniref:Acetylserotonin O-methyltransferase n=1 Tax=Leptotrombidium deliense TaxID=299467 RepID=A0A443RX39_9ACAR|nr:hydroxyneurosporene methyltransferase-like protein [Leptotrombidium deliense]
MQASYSKLTESVKTGKCYFEEIYGLKVYEWYKSKPKSMKSFVVAMQEYGDAIAPNMVEAYDFSQFNHIIDVGGGQGWVMSKILKSAPNAKGTVDRISFVSGNFMENVPSGGDCYILHNVIVDYNDDKASKILSNIAEKMDENTKLLITKQTLDTCFGAMFDIYMLVVQEGKERSKNEFEVLLSNVGLRVTKFLKTGKETCEIVEVMKNRLQSNS